jgi:hypothetical protein
MVPPLTRAPFSLPQISIPILLQEGEPSHGHGCERRWWSELWQGRGGEDDDIQKINADRLNIILHSMSNNKLRVTYAAFMSA